jgi:hypothetical protein
MNRLMHVHLERLKAIFLGREFYIWLADKRPEYGITRKNASKIFFNEDEKKLIKRVLEKPLMHESASISFIQVTREEAENIMQILEKSFETYLNLFSSEILTLYFITYKYYSNSDQLIHHDVLLTLNQVPWWTESESHDTDVSVDGGFKSLGIPGNCQMGLSVFIKSSDYDKHKSDFNAVFQEYDERIMKAVVTMIRQMMGLLNQ